MTHTVTSVSRLEVQNDFSFSYHEGRRTGRDGRRKRVHCW